MYNRKFLIFMPLLALILGGGAVTAPVPAGKPELSLKDKVDELNYSIGHQVGRDLVRQQAELRPEVLLQGIIDAKNGTEPLLTYDQMINVLAEFKQQIVEKAEGEVAKARRQGERFLAENAGKPGVKTLPSGLQYKILEPGTGPKPGPHARVKVSYVGRKLDGTQFDSTSQDGVDTPVEVELGKVIPGWSQALQLMPVGSRWEIYIPHDLAFRDTGPLAGQTIIYQVELLDILASK